MKLALSHQHFYNSYEVKISLYLALSDGWRVMVLIVSGISSATHW